LRSKNRLYQVETHIFISLLYKIITLLQYFRLWAESRSRRK
jgi:hypothetical protein